MPSTWPGYLELLAGGELARRAHEAVEALADCTACPRECHADRRRDDSRSSYCRTGRLALVSSACAHHGEEDCLRGWAGSGTIFFSRCNLRCIFCQNFDISWEGQGRPVTARKLAEQMLHLQALGCHNINFVTPSHVVPQILEALVVAAGRGLRLPDLKFWKAQTAGELANAADYPDVARTAVKEMHRQVGDLVLDERGLARRGLLVRHLVMPGGLDESGAILRFLAREVSTRTLVNVMPQYRPEGLAGRSPAIARPLLQSEFRVAVAMARDEGLRLAHGP